ncbi:MAG TPA: HD domain-containing phosphohydrolase [Solirubrobacteraceae bacterium]
MIDFAESRIVIVTDAVGGDGECAELLRRAGYSNIIVGGDPAETQRLCVSTRPDLLLLDLDRTGALARTLADIRLLTDSPEGLPVLAITSEGAGDERRRAVALGVRDFVTAPVEETEFLVRIRNLVHAHRLQQQLASRSAILDEAVRDREREVDTARESLSVLAAIADYHDDDTYQHAQRVGVGAALIAEALDLPEPFVVMLREAAPLHDLGKVGMSRRILLKPDKLTPAEWEHMMRHVEIGARILASAKSPVLQLAAEVARTHHERWDGNGYLVGLVGVEIPLSGRITALSDVWDTLTHERPYKPAWDRDHALAEIHEQSGRHFDPRVVDAFASIDLGALDDSVAGEVADRAA